MNQIIFFKTSGILTSVYISTAKKKKKQEKIHPRIVILSVAGSQINAASIMDYLIKETLVPLPLLVYEPVSASELNG